MENNIYKELLNTDAFGYAFLKIVEDDKTSQVSFVFVEVNAMFESITGLNCNDLLNKSTQSIENIDNVFSDNWITTICQHGQIEETIIDYFSNPIGKWYRISTKKINQIGIAIFAVENYDISSKKSDNEDAIKEDEADAVIIQDLLYKTIESDTIETQIAVLMEEIKRYTKAKVVVFSEYDPNQKALNVKKFIGDGGFISVVKKIAGEKIFQTSSPVSDSAYEMIMENEIGIGYTLTEVSFGAIPIVVDKLIRKLTGISIFYGIAHIRNNQLYGTTMIALTSDVKLPSEELLKSFAKITALSLKKLQAETALFHNEAKLKQITNNLSDVVFLLDMNLNTTYISPSIEQLTGDKPEIHLKKTLLEKHPRKSIETIYNAFKEEMQNEKKKDIEKNRTRILEIEYIKNDGSLVTTSINVSMIRDENSNVIAFLGVGRNITEQKKIQNALFESEAHLKNINSTQNKLFQLISHDLRSPFNSILGFSELLSKNIDADNVEKAKNYANIINSAAKDTIVLIDSLMTWSSTQTGRLSFKPEICNLYKIIKAEFELMKMSASIKSIILHNEVAKNINVYADINMLSTILRNLISNAVKFSQPFGKINISAIKRSNHIEISVKDSGIGIDKDKQIDLMSFKNINSEIGTKGEKGTGLGLNLCNEFILAHKGALTLKSSIGKGSTFTFTIPNKK